MNREPSRSPIKGMHAPTGYQMIHSIDIRNFRGFKHLRIEKCRRLNVLVGDNGVGKTALLEAVFLALCSDTGIALRHRQFRRLEGQFSGSPQVIEDAIFGDFFYRRDTAKPIYIELKGEGPEARALRISRGANGGNLVLPLGQPAGSILPVGTTPAPITFLWKDSRGNERAAFARATVNGLEFGNTGETLPDFFFFAANQTVSSVETAGRFSELSKRRNEKEFISIFLQEFDWIEDISVEVIAGSPALHATVKNVSEKLPIANISGGINRIIAIMLALASHPRSVALVDEIENGIYYKHHEKIWRSLLRFARQYDSQLFTTTHNIEWLEALAEAGGDDIDDLALWRMERAGDNLVLQQFSGRQVARAIKAGEVR